MNLKSIIADFSRKYGKTAAVMEKEILKYINAGQSAESAIKNAFADTGVIDDLQKQIQTAKIKAASMGIGYDVTGNRDLTTALNRPWDGTGVTFSQRVHLGGEQMRVAMVDEISRQIKLGASAGQVAKALYDGYGYGHVTTTQNIPDYIKTITDFARRSDLTDADKRKLLRQIRVTNAKVDALNQDGAPETHLQSAYKSLLDAVVAGDDKNIVKAINVAVNEKSRYIAERIARTETGRAYFDGVVAKNQHDPNVVAYKWTLGSRHSEPDICDMYADADLFGLGPGVYPKNMCPSTPAHPNCLCLLYPVYRGEVDMNKLTNDPQKGGEHWLMTHIKAAANIIPAHKSISNWQEVARGHDGFVNPASRLANVALQSTTPVVKNVIIEPVKEKTIDDCVTSKEAQELFTDKKWFKNANEQIDLDGCSLESVQSIFHSYEKIFTKFPQLIGQIDAVRALNIGTKYAQCYSLYGGRVAVNKRYFSDFQNLSKMYQNDIKHNFHPVNTDASAIVSHEISHAIDGYITNKGTIANNGYGVTRNLSIKRYSQWLRPKILKELHLKVADISSNLSIYGSKSAVEWFAECMAEYFNSPHPRAMAMAVGREVEKTMASMKGVK